MTEDLRWGVLGAARFAREHMAPALHAAPGGSLCALATTSSDKAAGFREIVPEITVHDTYAALLDDPGIDAVYIPLPNHLHLEWTLRALEAGKHVLTEKPLAMAASEIDDIAAAASRAGRLAAEAFMVVHHPQWVRARALIESGRLGRLVAVRATFGFDNRDPGDIRNQAKTGGGALRDIGVYVLGTARFATDAEPEDIAARIVWEDGVDVRTEITASLAGAAYSAIVSIRMAPWQDMIFHGEAGMLRLSAPFNGPVFGDTALVLREAGGREVIERFNAARQYEVQVAAFNAAARGGAPFPCPLAFSRGTQDAIDRVFTTVGAP